MESAQEKVVVETDALSGWDNLLKGLMDYGQSASSLAVSMSQDEKSPQEITAALSKHAKGNVPEGQDPVRGLLIAWVGSTLRLLI